METYTIKNDIRTFGKEVPNFPSGIGGVFEELIRKTGDNSGERDYYGISEFKNGKMYYYAVAAEKFEGEGKQLSYDTFTIDKGDYLSEELPDWQKNTRCIKDIFMSIIQDDAVDKEKPAIEWYINDHEMLCMVMKK